MKGTSTGRRVAFAAIITILVVMAAYRTIETSPRSRGDTAGVAGRPVEVANTRTSTGIASQQSFTLRLADCGLYKSTLARMPYGAGITLVVEEEVPTGFATGLLPYHPSTTAGKSRKEYEYSTSFYVAGFARSFAGEFAVFGHPWTNPGPDAVVDKSVTIVELWNIVPPRGSLYSIRTGTKSPIGQSQAESERLTDCKDGTYWPLGMRAQPRIVRQFVARLDHTACTAAVDPDGRYILVGLEGVDRVVQIDLVLPGFQVQTVMDTTLFPGLVGITSIDVCKGHDSIKRYIVDAASGTYLLNDPANSGVFVPYMLTPSEQDAQTYTYPRAWLSNYYEYDAAPIFG